MSTFSVSVVIPCHNVGRYLTEAVDSVLTQTGDFTIREVVVVDDHSTDGEALDALSEVAQREGVVVVQNTGGLGAGYARNVGVAHSRGDWVVFLDADDVLTAGSIQARRDAVRIFPDVGFVSGDFRIWQDGHIDPYSFFSSRPKTRALLEEALDTDRPILLRKPVKEFIDVNLISVSALLVCKQLYEALGGMDGTLRRAQDYHFAIRAAAASDFVFVPYTMFLYRQHADQVTRWNRSPRAEAIDAFSRLSRDPALAEHRERLFARISSFYLDESMYFRKSARYGQAIRASLRALRLTPTNLAIWRGLGAAFLRR